MSLFRKIGRDFLLLLLHWLWRKELSCCANVSCAGYRWLISITNQWLYLKEVLEFFLITHFIFKLHILQSIIKITTSVLPNYLKLTFLFKLFYSVIFCSHSHIHFCLYPRKFLYFCNVFKPKLSTFLLQLPFLSCPLPS